MSDAEPAKSNSQIPTTASAELPQHLLAKLRIVIPGYELLDEIASGGQATVYRAREITSGLTVAVKVLHGGPIAGDFARDRLRREILTLQALNHPNIVCVIESGSTPTGLDYLVMNYIPGRPLSALWSDFKFCAKVAPEPADRIRLFKRICDIVQTAHLKGITHRDLSPSNILITDDGEPHILGFGLASTAFNDLLTPLGKQVSVTGQFLGKVQYASPEQARGGRDAVDIRSDVYALGVILYQILTNGAFPYDVVGNLIDVLNNIVNAQPTPPSTVVAARRSPEPRRGPLRQTPPAINQAIETIVLKSLAKDPARRYQSAGEFAADVECYFAGQPTEALGAPSPARPRRRMTMTRRRLALAGIAVVGLLIGSIAVTVHFLKRPAKATSTVKAAPRRPGAAEVGPAVISAPPPTRVGVYSHGGDWRMEGDELVERDVIWGVPNVVFGDPNWRDFDLTVDVQRQTGSDLCAVIFRRVDAYHDYHYDVGQDGNKCCEAIRWNNDSNVLARHDLQLQNGRWYTLRVQTRGNSFECAVRDGAQTLDSMAFSDDAEPRGQIGLMTHESAYRFRNLKVTAPDGKLLWQGFPDLPTESQEHSAPSPVADSLDGLEPTTGSRVVELLPTIDLASDTVHGAWRWNAMRQLEPLSDRYACMLRTSYSPPKEYGNTSPVCKEFRDVRRMSGIAPLGEVCYMIVHRKRTRTSRGAFA